MDAMTAKVALRILKKLKQREAEYWEARRYWYESGDGRPSDWRVDPETGRHWNAGGRGWTYPECIHGTSRWTDYDNICGGCEDGYSIYQLAIWEAKEKVAQFKERAEWVGAMPSSFKHTEMYHDVLDWVFETVR